MVTSSSKYDYLACTDDDLDLANEPRLASKARGNRELSGQAKFQRKARFGRKTNAIGMSQTGLHRRRFRKESAL